MVGGIFLFTTVWCGMLGGSYGANSLLFDLL